MFLISNRLYLNLYRTHVNEVEWQKGADDCPMVQGNHPRGTSVCGKIPDGG